MTKPIIAVLAFAGGGLVAATAGRAGPALLGSTSVSWEEVEAPHAPHTHAEEELVIIKEGTLEAMQAGKTRRLGPGAVIFQASNQLHGVKNVGETLATYYVVRWAAPGMLKARAAQKAQAAPAPKP